jgi:hypothetical protein
MVAVATLGLAIGMAAPQSAWGADLLGPGNVATGSDYRYYERSTRYIDRDVRWASRGYRPHAIPHPPYRSSAHGSRRPPHVVLETVEKRPIVIERRMIVERPTIVERRIIVERPIIERRLLVRQAAPLPTIVDDPLVARAAPVPFGPEYIEDED